MKLGDVTLAQQSLADIQQLSAPRDVPTTYYATASNYVLMLLGQPPVDATGVDAGLPDDVRVRLHLLAVPVVDPKDAGADGGDDAGGDDSGVSP